MTGRPRRRAVSPPGRPAGEASAEPLVIVMPSAGRPETPGTSERPACTEAPAARPKLLAAEDRPEAWGDRPDDLSAFLQAERPPHW